MKIKMIRVIIMLLGVIGFIWYLLPVFTHRIINIGNLSGLILAIILILYSAMFNKINSIIIKCFRHLGCKIILSAIGMIIVVGIVLVIAAIASMITAINTKPSANQTVVILGCRVYGEKPSLMLVERLDSAYNYLINNDDSVCILSGGRGNGEDISEAECMYRYLVDKGIDADRLYKEDNSTSTRENIAFSNDVIKENNLNNEIAIATNEFHEYRASKIAGGLGLKVTSVPGKTAWWLFPTYATREIYGIIYEWFF